MNRAERIFNDYLNDPEKTVESTALPPDYIPPYTAEDDPMHSTFERMRSVLNEPND